jgi:hypothetical protein
VKRADLLFCAALFCAAVLVFWAIFGVTVARALGWVR